MAEQHIKILERGFEKITGYIANVPFENGVSTRPVSELEMNRIAAAMRVESVEGGNTGVADTLVKEKSKAAEVVAPLKRASEVSAGESKHVEEAAPVASDVPTYTREELEAIADAKGIAGLREIADQFGVKSKSVVGLIDGIMDKQPAQK